MEVLWKFLSGGCGQSAFWKHGGLTCPPMRDEDFIGRYSKISRACHYPSIHPSISLHLSTGPPNRGGQRHQGASPFYIESKEVGFKIQDSRLRKNFLNPRIQDSTKQISNPRGVGFKIQGSEKTSWIQGGRIQDPRFQKRILESKGEGFKIHNSRLRKNFLNPRRWDSRFKIKIPEKNSWFQGRRIQDSRFKAQKQLVQPKEIGFKIQDSKREFLNPRR